MVLCLCQKKKISLGTEQPPGCTDVVALIVFVLFWCGMVIIASFAAVAGDPYRLVYGADSFGNTCGRKNRQILQQLNLSGQDVRQKPYLFSMDVKIPNNSVWICVEKCPHYQINNLAELKNFSSNYGSNLCSYEFEMGNYDSIDYANSNLGPCPVFPIYASKPILNRCVPRETADIDQSIVQDIFDYLNDIDLLQRLLTDLITCYQEIIAMCLVAFLLSFFVVFCIRFVAAAVIYLMFSMVGFGSLAITALLWYMYANAVTIINAVDESSNGTRRLSLDVGNMHALLVYAIFSTVVLIVLASLICCCLWQGTTLVVELFRQAGRCLRATPLLLIQPMWTFVALMILFIYWSVVVLLLATAANVHATKLRTSRDSSVVFNLYSYDSSINAPVKYFWWYHLIGLIWTAEFILACQQIIISGAVALWYFSKDKQKMRCAIWTSTKRLVLYHLGSVALGSLIITLIKIPRLLLMFMESKLQGTKNKILKCVLTCCTGCLWCAEKFLRYIHHNAYTIVAIEGQDFCPAAKQAFQILASNALQVSTVNTVGDFVLFMGKCGVTAIVGFIAAIVFKSKENLHFYAIPLLIVCLFSFFIAHCFFSVYEMVIDTLFLCYCENKRIIREQEDLRTSNDVTDSASTMFFADSSLRDFMNRVIVMDRKDPDINADGEELQTLRR